MIGILCIIIVGLSLLLIVLMIHYEGEIKALKSSEEMYRNRYLEDEKIIENIKNSLPFN